MFSLVIEFPILPDSASLGEFIDNELKKAKSLGEVKSCFTKQVGGGNTPFKDCLVIIVHQAEEDV